MPKPLLRAAAALFVALMPLAAQAALSVYTSKAAFLAAISNPETDTFNDLPLGSVVGPLSRSVGSYSYSADTSSFNFYNVGSAADVWLSPNNALDNITFYGFSSNVFGVGGFFFNTDGAGDAQSGLSVLVSAVDADGGLNEPLPNTTPTTFLGFVSTTGITQLRVAANQPTGGITWATVNDLVLGEQLQSIPEPGTLALLGLGLAGLAATRRRKQ